MSFLTLNPEELRKRWVKLYMNLMLLKSLNPKKKEILEKFHLTAALFNGEIMNFLDVLEK